MTTREGLALSAGEIAGPVVAGHNMFQSPQVFVDGKGSMVCKSKSCWRAGISSIRALRPLSWST